MRPACIFLCCVGLLAGAPNFCAAQNAGPAEPAKEDNAKASTPNAGAEARRRPAAAANAKGQAQLAPQQAQAAPAPKAVANPAAPQVKIKVEAELNAAQFQILDQFRPLMKTELDFAARACGLTDEQRKQLAEGSEETLKELVTGNVTLPAGGALVFRGGVQRMVIREGNRARVVTMSSSSRQFGSQVAALVHTNFPGEIEARYQKECAERSAYQKRAAIDNTIVNLDKQLMLTEEQRKQIGEALAKAWSDPNLPNLQMLLSSTEYLPPIPDNCVTSYLRPAQQAVWQTRNTTTVINGAIGVPAPAFEPFAP